MTPLFMLMLGMFETGMIMFNQASIEGALREAARYGITGQDPTGPMTREEQIAAIISDYTFGMVPASEITITSTVHDDFTGISGEPLDYDANGDGNWDIGDGYEDINGNLVWDAEDVGTAGYGAWSQIVEYRAEYDWPLLMPFSSGVLAAFNADGDGAIHLSATMVVRNEPLVGAAP